MDEWRLPGAGGRPSLLGAGVVRVDGGLRAIRHTKDGKPHLPGQLNQAQTDQLVEQLLGGASKPAGFPCTRD